MSIKPNRFPGGSSGTQLRGDGSLATARGALPKSPAAPGYRPLPHRTVRRAPAPPPAAEPSTRRFPPSWRACPRETMIASGQTIVAASSNMPAGPRSWLIDGRAGPRGESGVLRDPARRPARNNWGEMQYPPPVPSIEGAIGSPIAGEIDPSGGSMASDREMRGQNVEATGGTCCIYPHLLPFRLAGSTALRSARRLRSGVN
jgi:hypothetical protein